MVTPETALSLNGPSGMIEALYFASDKPKACALFCHPNPLEGGDMHHKVISTLQRLALDMGMATLRFNFHGVGKSSGKTSLGLENLDDAKVALNWLVKQHPETPVVLMGFSFGGYVAVELLNLGLKNSIPFIGGILAAPAVQWAPSHGDFENVPLLVVQPSQDEILSAQVAWEWTKKLKGEHQFYWVEGASHFFHGRLIELKNLVAPILKHWMDQHPNNHE